MTETRSTPNTKAINFAYRQRLAEVRWQKGFKCPNCGHTQAYKIASRLLMQCKNCKKQTSPTAGTVLHGMKRLDVFERVAQRTISDIAQGITESTKGLAGQMNETYSTVWAHRHKLTPVLHELLDAGQILSLACDSIKQALYRPSSEPPQFVPPAPPEAKELSTERDCDEAKSLREETAESIVRFLLKVFHGVSRKYAQKYVSEFGFRVLGSRIELGTVILESIRGSPLPRLIDYHSPYWLEVQCERARSA